MLNSTGSTKSGADFLIKPRRKQILLNRDRSAPKWKASISSEINIWCSNI
jgi:hypothetical protein